MGALVALAGLLALLLLGLPVAAALALAALAAAVVTEGALPLFLGAAVPVARQIADNALVLVAFCLWWRMLDFADLPGRLHAALADGRKTSAGRFLALALCVMLSGAAGRGIVDAALRGRTRLPAIDRLGLSAPLATALLGALGVAASLWVPSMALLAFAQMAGLAQVDLMRAGLAPAALYLLAVAGIARLLLPEDIRVWPRWIEAEAEEGAGARRRRAGALLGGGIFLPVATMVLGIATPTEAAFLGAAVLAVLGGLLGAAGERARLASLARRAVADGVRLVMVLAGGSLLAMSLSLTGWFGAGSVLETLAALPLLLLLLAVAALAGVMMEAACAVVVVAAVFLPVATGAGFDPVWLGVALVVAAEFGRMMWALVLAGYPADDGGAGPVLPIAFLLAAPLALIAILFAYP